MHDPQQMERDIRTLRKYFGTGRLNLLAFCAIGGLAFYGLVAVCAAIVWLMRHVGSG
ncbi:MAG TPA: hypothetical protein VH351_15545 [Bryobacteraceae bacterium]|jgi:hypothetical protein|nr:hypothetical protein [Bryobacteraceae bacterium]